MSAAAVLTCAPLCGPLTRNGWSKRSVVRMCRSVVRAYTPSMADHAWTDSDDGAEHGGGKLDTETLFQLDLDDDDGDGDGATSACALRTISPGIRNSRASACYFVKPDWTAIAEADADYEVTLYQRRLAGEVLFFVEHGARTLRDGCHFIITDPKWLVTQFFLHFDMSEQCVAPVLWMQSDADVLEFWSYVRLDAHLVRPKQLRWEAQCVMRLLLHCGAVSRVSSSNAAHLLFPVRLFAESRRMTYDDCTLHDALLVDVVEFATPAKRDALAYSLAMLVCAICEQQQQQQTPNNYRARFFAQHVIVENRVANRGLVVELFVTQCSIRFFVDTDTDMDRPLLDVLLARLNAQHTPDTPVQLFRRVNGACCGSAACCALCTFSDVARAFFLSRHDGKRAGAEFYGGHRAIEAVEYAKRTGIA